MSCSAQDYSYYCAKQQRKVFFDYYALLNISKDASQEQIRKAYRKLAFLYHPDKCNNDIKEISKEKFKIIGDAYQNLICPEKRSLYNTVLLKMELKQNAKKQNPEGFCSALQSCSTDELIYFLVGSFVCTSKKNQQYYDCSQQQPDFYMNQSKNINNNSCSQNNSNYFQSKANWHESNMNNNSNNFGCNPPNNAFSDDENNSEESEGEPQCQGSDASSNSSEQNFYQKFSFFNNINTKEQLNPENFTLLKGIFNNNNCNQQSSNACDEFAQRFKWYQDQNKFQVKVEQQTSEKCSEQLQQGQENINTSTNNCMTQQSDSTNQSKQFNAKVEDMECENQNDDDISTNQKDDAEEGMQNRCKNRITKAHIKMLQKQNQNKKIIERIRNKKPVFSTTICKRIKKQN